MDENFHYKRNLKKIKCKIVNQTSVNSCFYWPEMLPENSRVSPNHADGSVYIHGRLVTF